MRKGEKLILHLQRLFPILDGIERAQRDSRLCWIIYNMTNKEFDKIIGKDKCKKCEQEKELEVCDDCYQDIRGEMLDAMDRLG